jgi:hypothetical protein
MDTPCGQWRLLPPRDTLTSNPEARMLTTVQKANILGKAGFDVPACPVDAAAADPLCGQDTALQRWIKAVEILYATYAAARAAKSLREAEEARQLDMLRRLSSGACA